MSWFWWGRPMAKTVKSGKMVGIDSDFILNRESNDMSDYERDFAPVFMQGVAMMAEGEYGEAVLLFDQVLDMEPVCSEAYAKRGYAKLRLDHIEDALEDLNMALEISPQQAEAHVYRAQLNASRENFADAFADLEQALEVDPDDINALMIRGMMNYDIDRYALAIADFDKVVELAPDFEKAYDRRAAAKQAFGKPEEALADIDKLLELEPDAPDAWGQKIVLLDALHRFDEVLDNIANMPRIFDLEENQYALQIICLAKGRTLLALGHHEEAITAFAETPNCEMVWSAFYGTAVAQGRLGQWDQCRQSLESVKKIADETESPVIANYCEILLQDWSEAKAALLPLIELFRSNMTFYAGETAYDADDYAEALRLYDKTLVMNPLWIEAYFKKLLTLQILGEQQAALATVEQALALAPKDERLLHFKGTLLFDMDKNDESEDIFSRLIEIDPQYPHYYHNRAKSRFEKGAFDEAIDDLTRALELLENDAGFLRLRAFCYWAKSQPDKAIDDFSRILYYESDNVDAMYQRAYLYRMMERYEEAIVAAGKVIEHEMEFYHADAYIVRGRSWGELAAQVGTAKEEGRTIPVTKPELSGNDHYEQRECYGHAAEDLSAAIRLVPDNDEARWYRGFYAYKDREYLTALYDFQYVEEQSPEMSSVYYWLGWCYFDLGDAAKSLAAFDKANEMDPDEWNYYGRSSVLMLERKFAEAEASCQRGLEFDPENKVLLSLLGDCLDYQGRHCEAEEYFVKSMTLSDDVENHYSLADNYLRQGKLDEATDLLHSAIEKDPNQSSAYSLLGQVLEMQGQTEQAKEMFLLAIRSEDPTQRSYRESEFANLDRRARAMTHLGRYEEALARFYQCLWDTCCTVRANAACYWMARSFEGLGRKQEALEYYQLALQYLTTHHDLAVDIRYCRERIAMLESEPRTK